MAETKFTHVSRALNGGSQEEKLAVLRELFALAEQSRAKADAPSDDYGVVLGAKPWREFRGVVGRQLFDQLRVIVRYDPPSEVRELAGDIMVMLMHPCAVGRVLELYERLSIDVNESPPLRIYKNLGDIGTGGAARALMWLWGTRWGADMAGALGRCKSSAAQKFLIREAVTHPNSHVRQMCIAYVKLPLTKAKIDLFIDRLLNGTYNERFTAILKVQELRVGRAAQTLMAMREESENADFVGFINDALPGISGKKPVGAGGKSG
jgi:hypothetical protein